MLGAFMVATTVAGFAMRLDDNHRPEEWRQVAECFETEGLRCSFAVVSSRLSPEQGACLRELAERGHEIMDHTAQHAMYVLQFCDADAVACHRSLTYVSHMRAGGLPGKWSKWLELSRNFAHWLRTSGIRTSTVTGLMDSTFARRIEVPEIFPSLSCDRDGDGIPDGIVLKHRATADVKKGIIVLPPGGGFHVKSQAGLFCGKGRLSLRVQGRASAEMSVTFTPRDMDGKCRDIRRHRLVLKENEACGEIDVDVAPTVLAADVCVASSTGVNVRGVSLSRINK